MRTLAALALTLVLLAGCSDQEAQDAVDQARDTASDAIEDVDLPSVDWQNLEDGLQSRIDTLAEQADCDGLKDQLAAAEDNDTSLTRYIKAQIRAVDC